MKRLFKNTLIAIGITGWLWLSVILIIVGVNKYPGKRPFEMLLAGMHATEPYHPLIALWAIIILIMIVRYITQQKRIVRLKEEMDFVSKPGDTIIETMNSQGVNIYQLANKMNIDLEIIVGVINAEVPLTMVIAVKLQKALGISCEFWVRREQMYRLKIRGIQKQIDEV